LIANAIYILNGIQVRVTSGLTESINARLWSNALLADSTAPPAAAATTATTAAATTATTAAATTAAATTCTSSSPECCWVVESWKKMGKTTLVDPTNPIACCANLVSTGIPGVTCTSAGIVTEIDWYDQGLQGPIPSSLGNLVNLQRL
jgi:hypothetical protein